MKTILLAAFLFMNILLAALDAHPNTIIVKTSQPREITRGRFGLKAFDDFMERYTVKEVKSITKKADNRYYLIQTDSPIDFEEMETKKFAGIEYTQPNQMNELFVTPNDPLYHEQLLNNINLPRAWNYSVGNEEIVVAIIDSGLHFDHPDLQENIWYNEREIPDSGMDDDGNGYIDDWRGWDFVDAPEWEAIAFGDFVDQDNEPFDDNNHGTHVSGIIGATSNNEEGISGVCWDVKLMILRAGFNSSMGGYLQDDDAAAALFYAADMGADVISLSWGDNKYSPIIADACQYAYSKGSIIVASSGNAASSPIMYPARLSTTIAVGAVDSNNSIASFSSYGPNVDIVAPGVGIISTFDVREENLYQMQSGTSMSAPFVAGAVALLLGENPTLSFEEVKARLAFSSRDLGAIGFDFEYGYGLLDVYRLLTIQNAPEVKITYPLDNQAFSEPFPIEGTVLMEDFNYYTVMYTTEIEPLTTDWKNVCNHMNTPRRHESEVENGTLAIFHAEEVSDYLTDYQIRVRAYNTDSDIYEYKRTIRIDKTPPIFLSERSGFEKRYDGENSVFYLQTVYDEPVIQHMELINGNSTYEVVSARFDSIHVQKIPEHAVTGSYNVVCHAENEVGLTTTGEFPFEVYIDHHSVDINEYEQINLKKSLLPNRYYADFDGNGKYEFIAYEKFDGYNQTSVFEIDQDSLVTKHIFPEFMAPRAIGNTNSAGIDILGIAVEVAKFLETTGGESYPNQQVYSWQSVYGADFFDYDGDGLDEVALIKNIGSGSQQVVQIFKRRGNTFDLVATLENVSPAIIQETNIFVPKVVAGNLNNNNATDVLAADQEGDVMIFENEELIWMRRSPVQNTHFLGIGNFTGENSGWSEFCVGGYNYYPDNPALNVAYFEFFSYNDVTETFDKIGYISFEDIAVRNSIAVADVTGNGKDEIVIDVPPNIYIVAYDELSRQFRPIWKGDSASELQNTIVALPPSATQPGQIIANRMVDGELKSSLIRKREINYPLSAPGLFRVEPLNETTVQLSWQENPNAEAYRVYRKQEETVEFIAETAENVYWDNQLTAGESYWYQVTSYHSAENPTESLPTAWKEVIPDYPPSAETIEMISNHEVRIVFDRELRNDALVFSNFTLNNGYGYPHSASWFYGHNGVVLNFFESLKNPEFYDDIEEYELTIHQLFGRTGVPYQDESTLSFDFQIDVEPPYIVKSEQADERSIKIFFNEELHSSSAEQMENYSLIMPIADSDNSIQTIQYGSEMNAFFVTITLQDKPKLSNQEYFLKVSNVKDVAGNEITNEGNKITFTLNDISKLEQHVVAPNPFETKQYQEIRFFLPVEKNGTITIYDLSGAIVFEDAIKPLTRLQNFYAWSGKNVNNQRVSSGLYFYVIKMGNEMSRGKFAVIN